MKQTENLKLNKIELTDSADITVINPNWDSIDNEITKIKNNKVDKVNGKVLSTNDFTTAEKTKLNGITANATKTEASTTNGKVKINGTETTVYTHPTGTNPHGTTKSDVGLGNVDNTSDLNKPISNATQKALDGKANSSHTHSNYTARINLTGQCQKTSYRKSVIALCKTSGTNTSLNSYSIGSLYLHRTNGLEGAINVDVSVECQYGRDGHINASIIDNSFSNKTKGGIRPCTFTYKGINYGGIEIYIAEAELAYIEFNGTSNFDIFALDYYQTNLSTPSLIDEVTNSISFDKVINTGKFRFNGHKVYHEGNKPTKTDMGLGNVDNTSDANKPISTATQNALNLKADKTHVSDTTAHITASERTNWNGKANASHTHTKSQITDFPTSLPANGGNADTVDGKHFNEFVQMPPVRMSVEDLNNANYPYAYRSSISNGTQIGLPTAGWYHIDYFRHLDNNGYGHQVAYPLDSAGAIYHRWSSGTSWRGWSKIYDSVNKPTPDEIGASEANHYHDDYFDVAVIEQKDMLNGWELIDEDMYTISRTGFICTFDIMVGGGGVAGAPIFRLPEGFRPDRGVVGFCYMSPGVAKYNFGYFLIQENGDVELYDWHYVTSHPICLSITYQSDDW